MSTTSEQRKAAKLARLGQMMQLYQPFSPEQKLMEQRLSAQLAGTQQQNMEAQQTAMLRQQMLQQQFDINAANLQHFKNMSPLQRKQLQEVVTAAELDNARSAQLMPFVLPGATLQQQQQQAALDAARQQIELGKQTMPFEVAMSKYRAQLGDETVKRAPLETQQQQISNQQQQAQLGEFRRMQTVREQAAGAQIAGQLSPFVQSFANPQGALSQADIARLLQQSGLPVGSVGQGSAPGAQGQQAPRPADIMGTFFAARQIPGFDYAGWMSRPDPGREGLGQDGARTRTPFYHTLLSAMEQSPNDPRWTPEDMAFYQYMKNPVWSGSRDPDPAQFAKYREQILAQLKNQLVPQ